MGRLLDFSPVLAVGVLLGACATSEPSRDVEPTATPVRAEAERSPQLHYDLRFHGRRHVPPYLSGTHAQALKDGLEWLANHQEEDGSWDSDGFMKHDPADDRSDGPGQPEYDVGLTGLALLAFLGDGHTMSDGLYPGTVTRGIRWLRDQQDPETGLLGERVGHAFLYSHAIATAALCEACTFEDSLALRASAQEAVDFILGARNAGLAWRYTAPPDGDNDSSVTAWMVLALKAAEKAGLKVDPDAYSGALAWFEEVTEDATGRVGYDFPGSSSSRVVTINDQYRTDRTECMTAVGLLCRLLLGQKPEEHEVIVRHAELILKSLPTWSEDEPCVEAYYWFFCSHAMLQMGGEYHDDCHQAVPRAVQRSQGRYGSGSAKGSWDPSGSWGFAGGRIYATALCVLSLEAYFRYRRVLGDELDAWKYSSPRRMDS